MLRIHDVAMGLIRDTAGIAEAIGRRDRDLERQYRRARGSVPANVAEGSDQIGQRRRAHYSVALGSAREAWSHLQAAEAWGYVAAPSTELKSRFDHVIGALHIVVHGRR